MKRNRAFTLAEVLITLVIIGVIAAMTIPTLMGNTNNQEMKTGLKKGFSAINQALALDYALYGKMPGQSGNFRNDFINMMHNHLSIVDEKWVDVDGTALFVPMTADGILWEIWDNGYFYIDANGKKGNGDWHMGQDDVDAFLFYVDGRTAKPATDVGYDMIYN